jgi:hypothetical protein
MHGYACMLALQWAASISHGAPSRRQALRSTGCSSSLPDSADGHRGSGCIAIARTYPYLRGALHQAVPHLRITPPCAQLQWRQQRRTHHAQGAVIITMAPRITCQQIVMQVTQNTGKWLGPLVLASQPANGAQARATWQAFRKSASALASADSSSSHIRIFRLACSVVSYDGHRCWPCYPGMLHLLRTGSPANASAECLAEPAVAAQLQANK